MCQENYEHDIIIYRSKIMDELVYNKTEAKQPCGKKHKSNMV